MHLTYFSVQGFKNFVDKVELEDLRPINVIHGDNNVGKSNLLQAIWLFFRLAHLAAATKPLTAGGKERAAFQFGGEACADLGFEPPLAFHVVHFTEPIVLCGRVKFDHLDQHGLALRTQAEVEVTWTLKRFAEAAVRVELVVKWERAANVADLADNSLKELLDAVGAPHLPRRHPAVTVIPSDRSSIPNAVRKTRQATTSSPMPDALTEELYRSRDALSAAEALTWRRYKDATERLRDLLDDLDVLVVKPGGTPAALAVDNGKDFRLPVRQLGTGIQQLLALLAHLLNAESEVVLLEEPELNLRYSLQERLGRILESEIVGKPGGPKQVFITSHSPAFEGGQPFYWMTRNEAGNPVLRKTSADRARDATAWPPADQQPLEPNSWVTTEGLLKLPKRALDQLGVLGGSVIVRAPEPGRVEVLTYEKDAELHG